MTEENAPRWYILNHIPLAPGRNFSAKSELERFNATLPPERHLEIFAPTFVKMEQTGGKILPKERPLLFHYVFMHGRPDDIKRLSSATNGYSLILSHNAANRYLMVSDAEMQSFRIIANAYGNALPCYSPDEVDLQEGDIVEVVAGDFPGLRGVYIPRKGSKSGNIMLQASQNLGVVAYNIKADYIRILSFAKGSKRPYDQLDAYLPVLLEARERHQHGEPLTAGQSAHLTVFLQRYGATVFPNPKLEAKYAAALSATADILHDADAKAAARRRLEKTRRAVTNPTTLQLLETLGV